MKFPRWMQIYAIVLFCVVSTGLAKPVKRVRRYYNTAFIYKACKPTTLSHSLIEPGYTSFCGIATVDCNGGNDDICGYCAKMFVYKSVNGAWQLVAASIVNYDPGCGNTSSPDEVIDITKYGHGSYYATWAGYQGCVDSYNLWFDQSRVITY